MTVFLSLQSLAEKYEKSSVDARNRAVVVFGSVPIPDEWVHAGEVRQEFAGELVDAWPLLEAALTDAIHALERARHTMKLLVLDRPVRDLDETFSEIDAALSSLTGEPR